jgi:hypothetical protein
VAETPPFLFDTHLLYPPLSFVDSMVIEIYYFMIIEEFISQFIFR